MEKMSVIKSIWHRVFKICIYIFSISYCIFMLNSFCYCNIIIEDNVIGDSKKPNLCSVMDLFWWLIPEISAYKKWCKHVG